MGLKIKKPGAFRASYIFVIILLIVTLMALGSAIYMLFDGSYSPGVVVATFLVFVAAAALSYTLYNRS